MGGDDESSVGTCGNVAVVTSVLANKSRTYGKSFPHTRNLRLFERFKRETRVSGYVGARTVV